MEKRQRSIFNTIHTGESCGDNGMTDIDIFSLCVRVFFFVGVFFFFWVYNTEFFARCFLQAVVTLNRMTMTTMKKIT